MGTNFAATAAVWSFSVLSQLPAVLSAPRVRGRDDPAVRNGTSLPSTGGDAQALAPSYLDPGSGGPDNEFTSRNTTFMTWNLMHIAWMLHEAGGIPAYGNQRATSDDGERIDWENPEYRR